MPTLNPNDLGPFSAPVGQRGRRGMYGNRGLNRMSHLHNNSEQNPSDLQPREAIEPVTAPRAPMAQVEWGSTGPCNPIQSLATLQDEGTATSDCDRVLLKARIRELEHKNLCHATERTELKSQLDFIAEKQRVAENQWAAEEEERVQSAVNSAFQKAMAVERRRMREGVQQVRSEAREEIEAEREWWRGEVRKIRAEAEEEVEKVRREVQAALRVERNGQEAAKERIRAGIREAERALALLEVDSETEIKQE
jgi:hypothetical protein